MLMMIISPFDQLLTLFSISHSFIIMGQEMEWNTTNWKGGG